MKKWTTLGYLLTICLFATFLGMPKILVSRDTQIATEDYHVKAVDETIHIGLLQFIAHPALDDIRQGIYDGLGERGYVDGENIKIDYQNGQGDQSNLKMLAEDMMNANNQLLVGLATPAAQALNQASNNRLPLVMAGVTDPVDAGLVKSLDQPGRNVSGTSDLSPVSEQLDLIQKILPDIKTLGILYNSSETNAEVSVRAVKAEAEKRGITIKEATISQTNDLAQVGEKLAANVEAIYVPNDNTIASAMPTLIGITDEKQVPVFPAVDTMVSAGGLATVGVNQYQIGRDTANIIADAIEGADLSQYAIVNTEKTDMIINPNQAERLNLDLPKEVSENAKTVEGGN